MGSLTNNNNNNNNNNNPQVSPYCTATSNLKTSCSSKYHVSTSPTNISQCTIFMNNKY